MIDAVALTGILQLGRIGGNDVDDALKALELVLPIVRNVLVKQHDDAARAQSMDVGGKDDGGLGLPLASCPGVRDERKVLEAPEIIIDARQKRLAAAPDGAREAHAGHFLQKPAGIEAAVGNIKVKVDLLHEELQKK